MSIPVVEPDESTHCQAVQKRMEAKVEIEVIGVIVEGVWFYRICDRHLVIPLDQLQEVIQELTMRAMHAEAEAYALTHPTPTGDEELAWARTIEFQVLEDAMWGAKIACYDECVVELDEYCPHGYKSPLIILGMI